MPQPRPSPHRAALAALVFSFALGALAGACGTANRCDRVRCSEGLVCEAATGRCIPGDGTGDGGTDGGASDAGCSPACAAPQVCDPATAICVECLTDTDCRCPTTSCTAAHACVVSTDAGAPVASEACTGALARRTCAGAHAFTVNLTTVADDLVTSCGAPDGGGGRDAVYLFVLDAPADVRVTATPSPGSGAQPVVALRRGCEGGQELACKDTFGNPTSFTAKSLAAGTYAVVVDGYDAASNGLVAVTVEVLPPTLPANETCPTAEELPLDGGPVTVDVSTALDDVTLACNFGGASPDVFYRFTLTETSDVFVTAAPLDARGDAVLALRSGACGGGASLLCFDQAAATAETLRARALSAGTWAVALESYGATDAGAFTVTAAARPATSPPSNDTCALPRPITFEAGSNTATLTVDTWLAFDDEEGSCNPSDPRYPEKRPEVVYSLTLSASRTVAISAQAASGTPTDAVVYLRSGACDADAGVELNCADSAPPSPDTFTVSLPAGTYYLFVEGYTEVTSGPTVVTVTLSP